MWCPVAPCNEETLSPSARAKHSATLVGEHVYLIGGRNGNVPLKDMWRYNLTDGKWTEIKASGERPPCLQEHSVVTYKDSLYVFGGEFSSGTETPLWKYDIKNNSWKKLRTLKGDRAPSGGRRGHTALIHDNTMLIYGGYQDLRGSSSELWSFNFDTRKWTLLSCGSGKTSFLYGQDTPPGRHKHSAIIHDHAMWIYGGMTDLQERSDLWKWDLLTNKWKTFKFKQGPGPLHSHAACKLPGCMVLFGGESNGHPTNELWKFNFDFETWDRIQIEGLKPQPRAETIAFTVPELLLKPQLTSSHDLKISCSGNVAAIPTRVRLRTSTSADRVRNRHSSFIPSTKISPTPCEEEQTFVFKPGGGNYADGSGSDESFHRSLMSNSHLTYKSLQPASFLREIQKLSQLNLSKFSGSNKCSYSALNHAKNESMESLLHQLAAGVNDEKSTPVKSLMVKSQSAHLINKRRNLVSPMAETTFNDDEFRGILKTSNEMNRNNSRKHVAIPHEPISVPNFSSLTLPTPTLTTAEAARLVFVDTDSEDDPEPKTKTQIKTATNIYASFKSSLHVARDESYTSHLCYESFPKSASTVKFKNLKEDSNDESSTSDYVSEKVTNLAFGFCNPNYYGPSEKDKSLAKSLNTPDSGVGDLSSRSTNEMMEMKTFDARQTITNQRLKPPTSLPLKALPAVKTKKLERVDKRSVSAGRVERRNKENEFAPRKIDAVPIYIFIIGGKEHGQVTVFKRPISIWRLKLY